MYQGKRGRRIVPPPPPWHEHILCVSQGSVLEPLLYIYAYLLHYCCESLGTPGQFSGKTSLGCTWKLNYKNGYTPYILRRRFRFVTYVRFAAYFQIDSSFWKAFYTSDEQKILGYILYIIYFFCIIAQNISWCRKLCYEVTFISGGEMWWSATYQYIVIHPRHVAHDKNSRGVRDACECGICRSETLIVMSLSL